MAWTTPEVPFAASPPSTGNTPSGSYGQSAAAVAARYSVKFSVVPESSERLTGVMAVSGSWASGLSAAIAGSFHVVIFWLKIFAMVAGREVERVDALEVEGHRDRADVQRQVHDAGALGAARARRGDLLGVHGPVGAGEVDAALGEGVAATAGAHRVVVDGHALVLGLEAGDPGLHRRGLRGGTGTGEGAAQVSGCLALGPGRLVGLGAAAGGEGQRAGREDGREAA
jgi:hypothetical protein